MIAKGSAVWRRMLPAVIGLAVGGLTLPACADDFTPQVYTPAGFAWIRDNNFRAVLERHVPQLRSHFANVRNVFFPWDK